MVWWLWATRCGVSMGELNLLRPRPVTLLRRRRCILSCALLLVMLGIYGLWIERESVRAQLTDLQQLQAKRRLDQQQQQLQQAALQQRAEVVEQQRRIINVLRGVAMSKAASAHYTKVQWAEDGWSLHGQASNHKEVASIVSKLKAVRKAELQRQQELLQLQPLATELLQIRYARADALAELFVKKGSRLLSKRGAVAVDERTNTLVVTDTAERLAWVRRTLATLDKPLRQVQIEARIAIVSSNLSEQLGFRWQLGGTQTRHDGAVIEASAVAGRAASGVGVALVDLGYARPTSWLDSQLSALASKGQAQVLAKPAIMTLDNASALIESGVEIPYQEVSTSGATSTSFKEASLSLEVAPQITPDNRVIMQLRVKQDTVGQIFNGVPSINTNRMETHITVANGQTLVLGGIFQTDQNQSTTRTPLLGSAPVIGGLFRHCTLRDDEQELLVFVTPTIVTEEKP